MVDVVLRGGEAFSKNELSVEELLLRCDSGLSFPSLLRDVFSEDGTSTSATLKDDLDLRRSDKSLMNEGMVSVTIVGAGEVPASVWLSYASLFGVLQAACTWPAHRFCWTFDTLMLEKKSTIRSC